MRILLVEDNDMIRDMLQRLLVRFGYAVDVAVDGLAALDAAASGPDLIIMDLSLPKLDGWEVTRRLKSAEQTRTIPIIALTAHVMTGDRERALEAGCDEFETKPVSFSALRLKIEALLESTSR